MGGSGEQRKRCITMHKAALCTEHKVKPTPLSRLQLSYASPVLHHVPVTGLPAGKTIYYSVGEHRRAMLLHLFSILLPLTLPCAVLSLHHDPSSFLPDSLVLCACLGAGDPEIGAMSQEMSIMVPPMPTTANLPFRVGAFRVP